MSNKKGEITTIIALGSMLIIFATSIASSFFIKKTQTTSTKAAGCSTGSQCSGSSNATCTQICGSYSNYVPNSQWTVGAIRYCCCKSGCGGIIPTIPKISITPSQGCYSNKKGGVCKGGTYNSCSDCEKICGIGQCQSCTLGSTTKWECIRNDSNIPACTKSTTYYNLQNCQGGGCSNCTQCTLQGVIRYECSGSGPQQCQPNQTICGNQCCNSGETCEDYKCVASTPAPTKTSTPAPTQTSTSSSTKPSTPAPTKTSTQNQNEEIMTINQNTILEANPATADNGDLGYIINTGYGTVFIKKPPKKMK